MLAPRLVRMSTGAESFKDVLLRNEVPEPVADALVEAGLTQRLFSALVVKVEDMEAALLKWLASDFLEAYPSALPALRVLWLDSCHTALRPQQVQFPPLPPSGSSGSSSDVASSGSWAETFAPKLSPGKVKELKDAFAEQYPSEILDQECMPSIRLLSLVFKQCAAKEYAFIPWKFRLSLRLQEEQQLARPTKRLRPELYDLLWDEVPTRDIPSGGGMGMYHCQQLLGLLSIAFALCEAAHLHTLRSYERAFMRFAFAKVGPDSGLRGPNADEMQQADRMIWSAIFELCNKGFCLDDATHEVVDVRAGVSTWLQPRPASVKINANFFQGAGGKKGNGKGRARGGRLANTLRNTTGTPPAPSSERPTWINHIVDNKGEKKMLCMDYNRRQGCSRGKNCKFLHRCCVGNANNLACGRNHPAFEHPNQAQ